MDAAKHLKRSFVGTLMAVLIALCAIAAATFAWYVYQTGAHTTRVHMAAGAGASLQIANQYDGAYSSAAVLDAFTGTLNPVSTNRIENGFQKVVGFTNGTENQSLLVASLFGPSDASDYYKTTLYIKTNGGATQVYVSDIGFEDSDPESPISTAIRVGFVAHAPGENQPATGEYIFAINGESNPQAEYNTATGEEGYVLDSTRTDGTTLPFAPYNDENFCVYDTQQGVTALKSGSVPLFTVEGDGAGGYGYAVELEVYIWLEGCDRDCTQNLSSKTLRNLALSFAGFSA